MQTKTINLALLRMCLFASGAVALILQMALEKYLSTLVGGAPHSVAIVLVLFFVGFAMGALCTPARCNGWKWLVVLELFIGGWLAFVASCFFDLYPLFSFLWDEAYSNLALQAVRVFVAAFWLLPPTIAMGMHFPVCMRLLAQHGEGKASQSRGLYVANVAGATSAALFMPYTIFYWYGVHAALYGAAVLCATLAAVIYSKMRPRYVATTSSEDGREHSKVPGKILYWAFFSGAMFFALEILWFHLIGTMLGSHAYTFSTLLAAVLLALAIGGVAANIIMHRYQGDVLSALTYLLLWVVVLLPMSAAVWPYLGNALVWLVGDAPSFYQVEVARIALVCCALLPVAISAGAIYPLLFNCLRYDSSVQYSHMGRLLAFNTAGVVFGILCMGYGLIAHVGSDNAFIVLWMVVVFHATWLAYWKKHYLRSVLLGVIGAAVAFVACSTDHLQWNQSEVNDGLAVYYHKPAHPQAEIIYVQEEFGSGITAIRRSPVSNAYTGKPYSVAMLSNGKLEVNDSWHIASQLMRPLAASFYSRRNEQALVIGLGSGHSTRLVDALGFKTRVCEISQGKIDAAKLFFKPLHQGVIEAAQLALLREDGRQCLLNKTELYDLITADVGSLWYAGATNLYSQQFYQQVYDALSADGVFSKHLQPSNLTPAAVRSVLATMRSVFPHVAVMRSHQKLFTIMASKSPISFSSEAYERYQNARAIEKERNYLKPIVHAFKGHWLLLGNQEIDALIADGEADIFTDANRLLEYRAARMRDTNAQQTRAYIMQFARPMPN